MSLRNRSSRRMRNTAIVCLLLALVVVVGFFGFRIWLGKYLKSEALRELVGKKTSRAIGVECTYMPLHWSGWSVYSEGFRGTGKPGDVIKNIKADQIRGELHLQGFRQRSWELYDLHIRRLEVEALQTTPKETAKTAQPVLLQQVVVDKKRRTPPDTFRLTDLFIQECHLNWNSHLPSSGSIEGLRAEMTSVDGTWNIRGTGGALHQSNLPMLKIERLNLRYSKPVLYVNEAHLKMSDSGEISLSGNVHLEGRPAADLRVAVREIPVGHVVPPDWRARLEGKVEAQARVEVYTDDLSTMTATGTIGLKSAVLHTLPLLDQIAMFTGTEQFRRITLQKAVAEFSWIPGKVTVTDLVLESDGLLRVEGSLVVDGGLFDGTFEIGVNAASLRWIPGSRTRVFTTNRGGYNWTTVRVKGPLNRLQEDLTPRLIAAAGDEVIESTIDFIEKGAQEVFDTLMPLLPSP